MKVSIRELKANPAHAIAMVHRGELVQITSHRKVVAELVAPKTTPAPEQNMTEKQAMQRLIDSGVLAQLPSKPFKLPLPVQFSPAADGKSMSEWVLEMRGPR